MPTCLHCKNPSAQRNAVGIPILTVCDEACLKPFWRSLPALERHLLNRGLYAALAGFIGPKRDEPEGLEETPSKRQKIVEEQRKQILEKYKEFDKDKIRDYIMAVVSLTAWKKMVFFRAALQLDERVLAAFTAFMITNPSVEVIREYMLEVYRLVSAAPVDMTKYEQDRLPFELDYEDEDPEETTFKADMIFHVKSGTASDKPTGLEVKWKHASSYMRLKINFKRNLYAIKIGENYRYLDLQNHRFRWDWNKVERIYSTWQEAVFYFFVATIKDEYSEYWGVDNSWIVPILSLQYNWDTRKLILSQRDLWRRPLVVNYLNGVKFGQPLIVDTKIFWKDLLWVLRRIYDYDHPMMAIWKRFVREYFGFTPVEIGINDEPFWSFMQSKLDQLPQSQKSGHIFDLPHYRQTATETASLRWPGEEKSRTSPFPKVKFRNMRFREWP